MTPPWMKELDQLRAQLDQADADLLQAAAQRQRIVAQIGALKARHGHNLFDRDRERVVFERAQHKAGELGLDSTTARGLMHVLVESSHRRQQEHANRAQATSGQPRDILIVGGGGQMGQLLARHFAARGHRVNTLEPGDGQDRAAAVRAAQITLLSVPMALAPEIARELGPHVPQDGMLCDINSLKEEICDTMAQHCQAQILGTHPMFGPTVDSLRRQKVVLCPVRPGPLTRWLTMELGQMGLEIIRATPTEHDRMMAAVQVLVHFHTIVMGEALRRTGLGVRDSLRFTSPIYRLELAVVGRLFTQDPDLYAEIEMSNPHGQQVIAHFQEAARDLQEIVAQGDRDSFRQTFQEVTRYFGDFGGEAMTLSDYLIETLVRRV